MAKSNADRSAKAAVKRKARGEEELRHRVLPGEKAWLFQLMEWLEDSQQASVMAGCLGYVHSLGREGARKALEKRHDIVISENVARDFHYQSLAELKRDPGDEVIKPVSL
jgi:hypothetical protein